MNDKQFDPLEERFRQAVEQFEPPYDPEDWMAMENLLDGKKRKRRVFPFWWITDALMVGMVFLFINEANKNWDKTEKILVTNQTTGAKTQLPASEVQKLMETDEPSGRNKAKEPNSESFHPKNKEALASLPVNQAQKMNFRPSYPVKANPKSKAILKPGSSAEQGNVSVEIGEKPGNTIQTVQATKFPGKNMMAMDTAVKGAEYRYIPDSSMIEEKVKESIKGLEYSENALITDSAKVQNGQVTGTAKAADTVPESKEKPAFTPKSKKGHFFVSGSFGLEKSGVKESSLGPSGNVFGGFAGYQWHKDWSVKMGIFFTDKNYSGGSGIYKVPPGSYYREITNFRAVCGILEIPLLVSYQFKHGKKSNWLISAGPVTSIMKKEEYHYNYLSNSGGTGYGKKYYSTNQVDWFSGFRISPSYQRFLGNRFSLSGEPFIQLPLSGVGEGSVKLFSLGFMVTTSIHFNTIRQH